MKLKKQAHLKEIVRKKCRNLAIFVKIEKEEFYPGKVLESANSSGSVALLPETFWLQGRLTDQLQCQSPEGSIR